MFKVKKIKTMQFLAKNSIIFILISGLYSCTKEPTNTPVSVYCNIINEKYILSQGLVILKKENLMN